MSSHMTDATADGAGLAGRSAPTAVSVVTSVYTLEPPPDVAEYGPTPDRLCGRSLIRTISGTTSAISSPSPGPPQPASPTAEPHVASALDALASRLYTAH